MLERVGPRTLVIVPGDREDVILAIATAHLLAPPAGALGLVLTGGYRPRQPVLDAIVERRAQLGGTWDLFRYPGIRSDSDMHTLGFKFEPWKHEKSIADGPAILDYLHRIVDERGRVIFKADLGPKLGGQAQLQGVWVDPALRGQGLSVPALSGMLHLAMRRFPRISLYVNDFNTPAIRAYERLGFVEVGALATVHF